MLMWTYKFWLFNVLYKLWLLNLWCGVGVSILYYSRHLKKYNSPHNRATDEVDTELGKEVAAQSQDRAKTNHKSAIMAVGQSLMGAYCFKAHFSDLIVGAHYIPKQQHPTNCWKAIAGVFPLTQDKAYSLVETTNCRGSALIHIQTLLSNCQARYLLLVARLCGEV